MTKIITLLLFLTIGFISCKTSEKNINKLDIAKQYYKALNDSDGSIMKMLIADSLHHVMPVYNYKETFSLDAYVNNWLKWDSVFHPTYKILEIEQENEIVKATISKIDKRIAFLQQEPFITNEILKFHNDKIVTIETEYIRFIEKTWDKNKTDLLSWIDKNHPELTGFIHVQTKTGGMKFLKAIELYENRQ